MLSCAPVRAIWIVVAAAGCSYRAGSFEAFGHAFTGQHLTVGCLDIAVARRPDGPLGSVLAYDVGNRCDGPVNVDLASVKVVGRTRNAEIELAAYDPRHELRALPLDGRAVADETVEYRALVPASFRDICVDAGRIAGSDAWTCVGGAPQEQVR